MNTADLYIRVSTEEQKLTGFSQRYQEEILRTFCEINSIVISNIVLEDYSAKTFNRPNWNKLFTQYKSHKLKTPRLLLITRWDRFSRNTLDAYSMLDKLSKLGIEVQAVEQPLDLSIPENKMMMAFFLTIPEVENTRRSLEIKKGLRKGAKEGRWLGLAPYGYINKIRENGEKCIEVVQTEARYMKMAFIDIAKNLHPVIKTYQNIVSLGYPRSFNAFLRAIRNPIYCGKIIIKDDPQHIPLLIEGVHEAIIEEDVFFKVQSLLNRKKINPRESKSNTHLPLRGILKCPKCKKMLTGSGSKNRTEKIYFYYHCQSKCGARFPANVIHQKFHFLLETLNLTDFYKFILQQIVKDSLQELLQHEFIRSGRLLKKIKTCEQKPQKIRALLLDGSIEPDEYKTFIEECSAQLQLLQDALKNSNSEITRIESMSKDVLEEVSNLANLFQLMKIENKQEFAKWLYPYGVEVMDDSFSASIINKELHPIFSVTGRSKLTSLILSNNVSNRIADKLTLNTLSRSDIPTNQAKHIIDFLKFLANVILN